MEGLQLVWTVTPARPPAAHRICAGCGCRQRFECSEKFRVNAHQQRLDAWLIYKCAACGDTWNCSIFRRQPAQGVDPVLFTALQHNDRRAAWRFAFDAALLKRNDAAIDPAVELLVCGPELEPWMLDQGEVTVRLVADYPLSVRLDALLPPRLGLSRSAFERLVAAGRIALAPHGAFRRVLAAPVLVRLRSL
jgi:hypothetical protein